MHTHICAGSTAMSWVPSCCKGAALTGTSPEWLRIASDFLVATHTKESCFPFSFSFPFALTFAFAFAETKPWSRKVWEAYHFEFVCSMLPTVQQTLACEAFRT